jgi:hypothetical protein
MSRRYQVYVNTVPWGGAMDLHPRVALRLWRLTCRNHATQVVKLTSHPAGRPQEKKIEAIGYSGAGIQWLEDNGPPCWQPIFPGPSTGTSPNRNGATIEHMFHYR